MKRNFFTPVLLLLGLFFSIGLVSCGEGAPDLSKKERDPREGLKLSNRTYEEYYLIERDTLYLWLSKDEMLARQYKRALAYTRVSKS